MIDESFGSTDALLTKLKEEAVGHFASGWAWLVLKDGKLAVKSFHDANTPVAHSDVKPLLTLDVWEHAYYIDYRNARPTYAVTVLGDMINWEVADNKIDGEGERPADKQKDCKQHGHGNLGGDRGS